MARTALSFLCTTSFDLYSPLNHAGLSKGVRVLGNTLQPLMLLIPSEMLLEQERCNDDPS